MIRAFVLLLALCTSPAALAQPAPLPPPAASVGPTGPVRPDPQQAPATAPDAASPTLDAPIPLWRGRDQAADPMAVIESDPLDIPADAFGLSDETEGGLPWSMWRGTPADLVERFLAELPQEMPSAAQRALLIDLTTSRAAPPQTGAVGPAEIRARLAILRLDALRRIGAVAVGADLARALPESLLEPAIMAAARDNLLLAGDLETPCLEVRALRERLIGPDWDRLRAFCTWLAGETQQADLQVSLLRERGDRSANFFALYEALSIEGLSPSSLPDASALDLAMLRAGNMTPPTDLLRSDDPAALAVVASLDSAPPPLRLSVAERAASLGALGTAALGGAYQAQPFEAGQLDEAFQLIEQDRIDPPRGRALLWQTYQRAETDAARAEIIGAMLTLTSGNIGSYEALVGALLQEIAPAPELMWLAGRAAALLFALGEHDTAQAWYDIARRSGDPQAFLVTEQLAPVAALAAGRLPDAGAIDRWSRAVADSFEQTGASRMARGLAVLDALGVAVEDDQWLPALGDGRRFRASVPSTGILFRMDRAADAGRSGETALLALLTLGEDGITGTHASILARVIGALDRAGLSVHARRLAIEALVGLVR